MKLKFRKSSWVNLETLKEEFGIQANNGSRKWYNAYEGDKPLVYKTEEERDIKLNALVEKNKAVHCES